MMLDFMSMDKLVLGIFSIHYILNVEDEVIMDNISDVVKICISLEYTINFNIKRFRTILCGSCL